MGAQVSLLKKYMTNIVMFSYYIEPKVIPNLLTEYEIEYIKKESINKFVPSYIGDNSHIIRKSETAYLNSNDPILNIVIKKCVGLTNKPFENCEQLQVLRYREGGYFKPHQDSPHEGENKRLYTFIIALNDDYEGGETSFPNLGIKFKLKKGDAVFFHTLDNREQYTSMALHAGEPVKSGEKWGVTLWVRQHPYT
jgi:predicted 2-oxoglutarate/Fe(II)-dependent dioxygenase YbiX|tara:strand:+ start:18 stop:602 length:585 start_codon:yes stop_codon:yes gene_type:complete